MVLVMKVIVGPLAKAGLRLTVLADSLLLECTRRAVTGKGARRFSERQGVARVARYTGLCRICG